MAKSTGKVFISYARADKAFVVDMTERMRAAGVDLWLDVLDIPMGRSWDDAIEAALKECKRVLVFLTPESVASQNVRDEISEALELGAHIIPVLLRPCDVPFRIKRLQRFDLSNQSKEELDGLIRVLRSGSSSFESLTPWTPLSVVEGTVENSALRPAASDASSENLSATPQPDVPIRPTAEPPQSPANSRLVGDDRPTQVNSISANPKPAARNRIWPRVVFPAALIVAVVVGYLQFQAYSQRLKANTDAAIAARVAAEADTSAVKERERAERANAVGGKAAVKAGGPLLPRESSASLPSTQVVKGDVYTILSMAPPVGTVLQSGKDTTIRYRVKYVLNSRDSAQLYLHIDQNSGPKATRCDSANAVNASAVPIKRGAGEVEISVVWMGGRVRPEEPPQSSGFLAPSISLWAPVGEPENVFYSTLAFRAACLSFSP